MTTLPFIFAYLEPGTLLKRWTHSAILRINNGRVEIHFFQR